MLLAAKAAPVEDTKPHLRGAYFRDRFRRQFKSFPIIRNPAKAGFCALQSCGFNRRIIKIMVPGS